MSMHHALTSISGLLSIDWETMAARCHEISVSKGFYEECFDPGGGFNPDHKNFPEQIALWHSEISELDEALSKMGPSAKIPQYSEAQEEIADILIRVMDSAHARGFELSSLGEHENDFESDIYAGDAVRRLHRSATNVLEAWRKGGDVERAVRVFFYSTLRFGCAHVPGFSGAVYAKIRYNEGRPYKHGGKRC